MIRSPIARLSFGLVMLTISALLFGKLLGIVPDTRAAELESRKIIAESLAVQVSATIARDEPDSALRTLRAVVARNASVLSAGVRSKDGVLIAQAGNHGATWKVTRKDKSTPTHVIVPLFKGEQRWGSTEVRFGQLGSSGRGLFRGSFVSLLLFVALSCFVVYQVFLRRALRELNPDAVIPERVRTALDTLAEGVLIVDAKERIMFANQAFSAKADLVTSELLGKPVNELNWELDKDVELPWMTLLRGDTAPGAVNVALTTAVGGRYSLVVNASPISGGPGEPVRGVMATFDDVTELARANNGLRHALERLESNEKEIRRQNRELQVLATRDPLTGCLNRRSLFQGFETLIEEARSNSEPLTCIMTDLDHFKGINDKYGHGIGDRVIKLMAELLHESAGPDDLVGRYGGEEFCVVMPGRDAAAAALHGEKLRATLQSGRCTPLEGMPTVTASFGVAELNESVTEHSPLVEAADEALYRAKERGRNCVQIFTGVMEASPSETAAPVESSTPEASQGPVPAVRPEYVATLEIRVNELEEALALRSDDGVLERVTGMPGRLLLLDRATQAIERAKRYRHHVVAMAVQMDAMPRVRDALGEMAAEKFREVAVHIIKETLRASDSVGILQQDEMPHSVARLGSEKIGILLTDIEDVETVPSIVRRLQIALAEPQEIAGNEISMSADIGISMYPGDSLDAVTLLRHASAAMSAVTGASGRDRSRFYAAEINALSKRRMRLETDLHHAIERKEFTLHYQPKVSMASGSIVGMEALLRWHNPRTGMVPPDEFIPVAEQIRCMDAISDLTIKRVCRQIAAWRDAGLGDVPIAVNLSPVEFQDPGLAQRILRRVEQAGIEPSLLEFEITESVVMDNADAASKIMQSLAAAGMRIAIDDFGTGYATLQCLTTFPVSTIKIDRSFTREFLDNPQDAAVVNGVTSLAHTMGLTVVAEGVENAGQLDYLRDLHCDQVQGYFLSRPVPSDEARELLANPIRVRQLVVRDPTAPRLPSRQGGAYLGLLNTVQAAEEYD